jgi:hypothetical protein
MASQTFYYREHNGKLFPTLPITLKRMGRITSFEALVDSGSTVTLLRPEVAEELGIPLGKGAEKAYYGSFIYFRRL